MVDPLAEKYYNVSPYVFTGNYGFNAREINGGLFIFVNGFDPSKYGIHLIYHLPSPFNYLVGDLTYIPIQKFKMLDSYGWGDIDDLYKERNKGENSLYIDGSMGVCYPASVRYHRGIKSGMKLIQKLRSGEYELKEGETIKIVGYSMGAAYAAGMAYALTQDPEYAHLLQFVDYLAPFQPTDFTHPEGVLGRQFASRDDFFNTDIEIKNVNVRKTESFGELENLYGHSLCEELYDFLKKCFNNGIPIYHYE